VRTIFITGVSSGLGRAFAQAALESGHRVVGTLRRPDDAAAFEAVSPARAHARLLDVTDDAAVARTVAEVESTIGAIDVVIANAGYGVEGIFEETPLADMRDQFATNVFGVAATLQAALPFMRQRRSGHLMAVTSMGGLMAVPGMSAYCASKFAVEGMLESLRKEVAGLGIHVTAISGNQLGDPEKAARAVLSILDVDEPPTHLVLGSDALRLIAAARDAVDDDIRRWDNLSRSTDFAGEGRR